VLLIIGGIIYTGGLLWRMPERPTIAHAIALVGFCFASFIGGFIGGNLPRLAKVGFTTKNAAIVAEFYAVQAQASAKGIEECVMSFVKPCDRWSCRSSI
jgi:hypothetical protein